MSMDSKFNYEFSLLFNNVMEDILITDIDNHIVNCNENLKLKLKYTYEELIGLNKSKILQDIKVTKESSKKYKSINVFKAYDKYNNGIYFQGKIVIGSFNNLECKYYILQEVLNDSNKNSIDTRELIDEIEVLKRNYQDEELFFNTVLELLCIVDTNGYFKRICPEWSKDSGWTEEELLSKQYIEFVHPEDREITSDMANNLSMGTEAVGFINRCLWKDGSYRWIQWSSRYIADKELIIAYACDITNQKEIEEKVKILENAIILENLKSEFFTNISHDFKTPLNIILATIQLVSKNNVLDPEMKNYDASLDKYIKIIKQNSYRLLKLVNNLIDLTKIESGFYELQLGNYNIVNVVEDIVQSVAQYIEDMGINLIFDTDMEELYMACDVDKVERIILNLLSNAIKYTDRGGTINVIVKSDENMVKIIVKDSGVGIEKSKLNIIFERFIQGENCLARGCEGSGIGLSLVKSIVELHGGSIAVESEVNRGSEFIIKFPIKLCDDSENKSGMRANMMNTQKGKCNVEFSDVYLTS